MISILNKKTYFLLLIFILLIALPVNAKTTNKNLVNIYFFHSKECSHCHNESKFLDSLEKRYNNIKIYSYEVHDEANNQIRINVQELYNIKTNGVPLTIIGDTPYIGYSEEKSNLTFIKTIEYYSRYGYTDQVGHLLQLENKPNYEILETNPTLETFLTEYGNYNLISNLTTDKLDITSNAIILGILSQFNLITIIATIIALMILSKTPKPTLLLAIYAIVGIVLNTSYIIDNKIYTIAIAIIIVVLFILNLISYFKFKNKKYLILISLIIIAITNSYLANQYYATYSTIFKELINLHSLTGLNKINYYSNYLLIIIMINLSLVMLFYSLKKATKKDFILYK